MTRKLYTTGEIYRQKLLISSRGTPYSTKAAVLQVVRLMPHERVQTVFGPGYAVTLSTIRAHNKKMSAIVRV